MRTAFFSAVVFVPAKVSNSTTSDHFQADDNALAAQFPSGIMQGKNLDWKIAFASSFSLGMNTGSATSCVSELLVCL